MVKAASLVIVVEPTVRAAWVDPGAKIKIATAIEAIFLKFLYITFVS
jgi:hypothetical protein